MNYFKKIVLPCAVIILLLSCAVQNKEQPKIKQGVYGKVTWLEGNMMPSPDAPKASNGRPIERTIYIYAVTTFNDVFGQAPLFSSVNTTLAKTVKTNKDGYYECELPEGIYSLFTKEPQGRLFANTFNGTGQISIIEVKAAAVIKLDIIVNYEAVF